MPVEIHPWDECPQGSYEWFKARIGIPTASMFCELLRGPRGGEAKGRRTYLLKKAGELLTGVPSEEEFFNGHMERGKLMEDEARAHYEFIHEDAELLRVGFVRNGRAGGSPDALIDQNGALEIKTCMPHRGLLDALVTGKVAPNFVAQCQGINWITEREYCDLIIYWNPERRDGAPGIPAFTTRLYRDEDFIKTLASEVARFNEEVDAIVEHVLHRSDPDWLRRKLQESADALPGGGAVNVFG